MPRCSILLSCIILWSIHKCYGFYYCPHPKSLHCAGIPGCPEYLSSFLSWLCCMHSISLPGHSIHGSRGYVFTMPTRSCYSSDCNPFLSDKTRILHMTYMPQSTRPTPIPLSPWLSGSWLQFWFWNVLCFSFYRAFFGFILQFLVLLPTVLKSPSPPP